MLLVGTDVKYGAAGAVANAAITPNLLDKNSIGIYLVNQTTGYLKLIVTSGASTGQVNASDVVSTDRITMFQGLGSGSCFTSETHQVGGLQAVLGSAYRVGTAQIAYIGYNPVTGVGDLNAVFYPTTSNGPYGLTFADPDLLYRQEAEIHFKERKFGNNEFGNSHYIQVPVVPGDTALSIATKFVAQANQVQPFESVQYWTAALTGNFLAAPVQSNITAALSGGTVPDGTYYGTIVYYGTNGSSIGSNEKSVVAASTSADQSTLTFTWSTPPTGTTSSRVFVSTTSGVYTHYYNVASSSTHTLTITALGSPIAGTVPTNTGVGISLTAINKVISSTAFYNDESPFPLYSVSVFGVIQNATVTEGGVIDPSGAPYQIRKIEKTSMAYRGDLYTLSVLDRHQASQVDFTATYDLYQVKSINTTADKTGTQAVSQAAITTYVAFVVQGDTPGTDQQADWEDIMAIIFPATQLIS